MTEPPAVYDVTPDPEPGVDTNLAAWIKYQALRSRELALELEVAAGHLCLSGTADNTDAMVGIRDTASRLAARTANIARHCRAGKGKRTT